VITVACVFVRGPYPYTPEYVYKLQQMVARWLPWDHRFVCVTDRPELLPSIDTIRIDVGPHPADGYWAKVRLFDPSLGLTGRVLYLDLDSIIVAPLSELVEAVSDFGLIDDELTEPWRSKVDRYGRTIVRKLNSSVMVWTAGEHADLWTGWTPAVADTLSTDQDWIGHSAQTRRRCRTTGSRASAD